MTVPALFQWTPHAEGTVNMASTHPSHMEAMVPHNFTILHLLGTVLFCFCYILLTKIIVHLIHFILNVLI
jgi:hypothetical protein